MKTIIFNIFCILVTEGAVLKTEPDNDNSLTSCVAKILEDIDYKKYFHLMDITVMNMSNDLNLSALHDVEGARFVSRSFFWDAGTISNMIYVVMSADYQELESGLSQVTSDTLWNPSAKFIIVLQSYESYSLRDITDLLHSYNIFYEVSLISRDGEDYAVYKYNFSKPGYCLTSGHLTFWSSCSDYNTEKKLPALYKGSIRNCRYKFITHNVWPYINFDSNNKGTEQLFIALFEKQFEVKIDLHEFIKVDRYGKLVRNSTQIMLEKVMNNEVEGVVGGYSLNSKDYNGNISYCYPMTIDHMFFIVAHSSFLEQWVAVLKQSFQACIVIGLLFVVFCVAVTFLSIFRTQKDVSYNMLVVFGYLLNKNVVKRPESGWPQTIIFLCLLFTAFIIPYAIQANLCSVSTRPVRGYEPTKPEDLENYHAALYPEWQYRNEFAGHWDCGTRLNCLMQVKDCPRKSLYTVVPNSQYQVFKWQLTDDQCQMALYQLKEPYISIYRTIFLRRGSVLIPYINYFSLQLSTTGVMTKCAREINNRELLKCKSHYRPEHVPLPLANFYYVFMILIVGYCLSIIMFIYEVWSGSQH